MSRAFTDAELDIIHAALGLLKAACLMSPSSVRDSAPSLAAEAMGPLSITFGDIDRLIHRTERPNEVCAACGKVPPREFDFAADQVCCNAECRRVLEARAPLKQGAREVLTGLAEAGDKGVSWAGTPDGYSAYVLRYGWAERVTHGTPNPKGRRLRITPAGLAKLAEDAKRMAEQVAPATLLPDK